ncbi:hypothetical protein I317_00521 [Kwoniella heveanensis CBS 569]|uniref:Uncharacterized protein n=1 Tax=Kwoniella heveanensis BCC8398 TaxID=1296120 RepID=A0A1B9GYA3_9TREE|nr:hypothetical protein I316_02494 [Kwoniella heveanensis BCC8398]OCF45619.1 hypothetical protein I317_00521 [Kwoniella heveanensis CBS 569]
MPSIYRDCNTGPSRAGNFTRGQEPLPDLLDYEILSDGDDESSAGVSSGTTRLTNGGTTDERPMVDSVDTDATVATAGDQLPNWDNLFDPIAEDGSPRDSAPTQRWQTANGTDTAAGSSVMDNTQGSPQTGFPTAMA